MDWKVKTFCKYSALIYETRPEAQVKCILDTFERLCVPIAPL